ncbi:MAG TPA: crotonase/enoyl-CoA hydratase family protein [Paracoccaceae bacterium]|nr:crotonase/enoyl-CoA hydratase family protein [Paracoccaceae bacterium]HMO73567.1 crotonase/enoyl-CoA hydratase family protein [Paracoccaceae bacterium]
MNGTIRMTTDARGIARLTLARADKHNALNAAMMDDLTEAARALAADDAVRAVVLEAEGVTFCAGGDLAWMQAQAAADGPGRAAEARRLAGMLAALDALPKPLIGRVQGNAFGGGIGMMAVCDLCVVAAPARFGLTETRLGLIPATIGPYVLARIGAGAARALFVTARGFGADEALRLGLASRVVPPEALDAALDEETAAALLCAPGAMAEAKRLIRTLSAPVTPSMVEASIAALVVRWDSAEVAEGTGAFFDRRRPDWAG